MGAYYIENKLQQLLERNVDWYKDTQTKYQVRAAIQKVLNDALPASYNRAIYSMKCDVVFDHFLMLAQGGVGRRA